MEEGRGGIAVRYWDIKSYNKDDHNFRVQRRNHIYHTSSSLANKLLIIDSQGSWRGLCGSGSPSPTQPSISSLILYVITYLSFPVKTTNLVFRKYSVELHWMIVALSSLQWLVLSRLHENLLEEKPPGNPTVVPLCNALWLLQEAVGNQGCKEVCSCNWGCQEAPPLQAWHCCSSGDQEVPNYP